MGEVEPDILTLPSAVSANVAALDADLDQSIPPKAADTNILVATWNLRAFSSLTKDWTTPRNGSPKRNFADIHYIATMIRRFDVVAVQEVRDDLRALRYLLKVLGERWAFILTDVTTGPSGNNERLAFLFDTRRAKPSGLACELVVWVDTDPVPVTFAALNHQFARTPYAVSFLSAGQTLTLVTLHINYGSKAGDRIPELRAIAEWLANWAEREFDWNHNLIALGDFNIDRAGDPLFDAFTSTGLTPAPVLTGLPRTIFDKADTAHFYDQIAWFATGEHNRATLTVHPTTGGHVDFVPRLRANRSLTDLSWHISDHYPLWVEFIIPRL